METACQPNGQVASRVGDLNNHIEELDNAIKAMEDRISCILEQPYPEGISEACDKAQQVPLALTLDNLNERFAMQVKYIRNLTSRIQL